MPILEKARAPLSAEFVKKTELYQALIDADVPKSHQCLVIKCGPF